MKILHTSDWHIGKKLLDKERFDEQQSVMDEIVDIANREAVDMVIVAGDLFDTYMPSSSAQRLLYTTLYRLSENGTRAVVCIAGNHDSPERVESPEALADVSGIFLLGYPNTKIEELETTGNIKVTKVDEGFMELRLPNVDYPVRMIYTPFANQERLRKLFEMDDKEAQLRDELQRRWTHLADTYCTDGEGVNLLATHLFVIKDSTDNTSEPDDENSINVGGTSAIYVDNFPAEIQYVALGHLHRCFKVGDRNIWYSGSPLEYSFAESEQDKYVLVSTIEPNQEPATKKVPLQSGRRLVTGVFESVDDAKQWLTEHQDMWVDMTLKTDNYLTATEVKELHQLHDKILILRPVVKTESYESQSGEKIEELIKDKDALFVSFFKQRNKGVEPNEEIMDLFHEILSK